MAAIFLFPHNSLQHQLFLLVVILGMMAGATVSWNAYISAYRAFFLPIAILTSVRFALEIFSGSEDRAMFAVLGAMFLLFSAGMYFFARNANHLLSRLFISQHEKMASDEKFQNIFELASDGIELVSMDSRFIDINHVGYERLGYTKAEMQRKNLAEFVGPDFAATIPERLELIKSQGHATFESSRLRKDGSVMPIEVNTRLVNLGGQPIFLGISRDISERKRMEAALTAREQQWRTLVENSPNTIARYDRDCRRIYVNPVFSAMVDGGIDALLGKKPSECPGGLDSVNYEAKIQEVFTTGKDVEFELNWKDKDSKEICSHIRLTAEHDSSGDVATVMGVGHDITELNANRQKIHQMAFYDILTRLPNRRLLQDRLQHALASSGRSGRQGAILFIDLDNFKILNDTLGHGIGDMLLQKVAERLTSCVREVDTVARLGGDEFVVMLEDLSEHALEAATQAEAVGVKILDNLRQPYQIATHEIRNTTSIGATLINGHQHEIEELLMQADIAMYQAKKAGRNTMLFFDPQMQETINSRGVLENELHKALENWQFILHYQIQVDSSRRPVGVEALIRWRHPERGLVSPNEFIPLAEETGLILPIGQWVMETACAQLKAWEQDALTHDLILSVNVSAKQFYQADFVAQVQATVQRYAINPRLLMLELTEGMMLENIKNVIAILSALKEFGVRFSLDDFGTGYSSLQYLKRLPIDQLKIDQSFVRDLAVDSSDKAIVRTIIAMAHSLNLNVIAEGVETEEQHYFLLKTGCTHYQGYLFGKPVPIEQFEMVLKQRRSYVMVK